MSIRSEPSLLPTRSVEAKPLRTLRAARLRRSAIQAGILAVAGALAAMLCLAVLRGLTRHGIGFSFGYLWIRAGIEISEGKTVGIAGGWPYLEAFRSDHVNAQALFAGLFNTIKISLVSIAACTILGTLVGVGRLSTNWLIRQICFVFVEFTRNTPLLIQLTFWYIGVVLKLPPMAVAARLYGGFIASQQGIYMPSLAASPHASLVSSLFFAAALILAAGCVRTHRRRTRFVLLAGAFSTLLVSILMGFPLAVETPVANRFQASGGTNVSPEMAALLLAISVNTAAYIAEIVRGAIVTMQRGQWEAAFALGLSRFQTYKEIILPQVTRVVLPSFGNQYISLAKNTSLGIAIGFPDLFNVYGTVSNQTGRSLEGILIVMVIYVMLSWSIAGCVNLLNRRVLGREAGQ